MNVGVGENLKEAAKPLIIVKNNIRIGIINFCENEWSIAKHDRKGANPLDIIDNVKQIQECRKHADFIAWGI